MTFTRHRKYYKPTTPSQRYGRCIDVKTTLCACRECNCRNHQKWRYKPVKSDSFQSQETMSIQHTTYDISYPIISNKQDKTRANKTNNNPQKIVCGESESNNSDVKCRLLKHWEVELKSHENEAWPKGIGSLNGRRSSVKEFNSFLRFDKKRPWNSKLIRQNVFLRGKCFAPDIICVCSKQGWNCI